MNLQEVLPSLVPAANAWVEQQGRVAATTGMPFSTQGRQLAEAVGVQRPDLIRILEPATFPLPDDSRLRQTILATGVLGPDTHGLTLGNPY